MSLQEQRMYIDGHFVEAASASTYENLNPATEEVFGLAADGDENDMDRAIVAARRASDETTWSVDHKFRQHVLEQLLSALRSAHDEIVQIVVSETGCPVALMPIQVDLALTNFEYVLGLARDYKYDRPMTDLDSYGMRTRRLVAREAMGVVAAITPWNFPFLLNIAKLAPSLAAGNSVVLKPAPETPWSAMLIGKVAADETDMPPGVLNIVTSQDRASVGAMLASDRRVDMVTFTGSSNTGKLVVGASAETVKKVVLELGGKSAHIFLDDANLVETLPAAAAGVCIHGGQGCSINTRLLLPRARYDEGVELVRTALENVPYGDPTDLTNMQGPQVSERQRDRVLGYIQKGIDEGAKLVLGGGRPAHLPRGYFVEPTLFIDVDPNSTIAQDEIFGPVVSVIAYEDDDDAVRIANLSRYGLAGSVTSASEERALSVGRRVRTGNVSVNGGLWAAPDAPYGGYKESGLGREYGVEGFEEFLELKMFGIGG